ncbi:MAG: DUF885 domain-containing protein [Flavobacteriaceae bacterium]
MKQLTFLIWLVFFFYPTLSLPQEALFHTLIAAYENYEPYDRNTYPLGDFSEERFERFASFCSDLHEQLKKIDIRGFKRTDQISYELLDFILANHLEEYAFQTHWNPILSDAGFHNDLVYRVKAISNEKEAQAYLNVLHAIPLYVTQQLDLLRKGLASGNSQPLVIFEGYASTYDQHTHTQVEDHFYYSPFLQLPTAMEAGRKVALQEQAKVLIEQKVIPSFRKIKSFFETEYYPKTRENISVSASPKGAQFYQNRIRYYTTLPLSAKEIHEVGEKEVKAIRGQMENIIAELGFNGNFSDFLLFLRTDSQFYSETPDQLLTQARDLSKRLDEQLPRFFKTLPRTPYGVAPVPAAIAPKYTGGRYIPTEIGSTRPGYYWVNTFNLKSRPLYVLPALTAHEAVPGHHLQMALNVELPDRIPQFRKDLYLSAYGEGWGLYAEKLAEEMGVYTTPYERFGQLTYDMWRACRLVVDTGIHAFGWSRQKAIDYMANNTALSLHEVQTEVDRYISWPGQALSYKIGELKIKALRQKAQQTLGDLFDLRDFHDLILSEGTLTLPLLEDQVNCYIKRKQTEINGSRCCFVSKAKSELFVMDL